MDPRREERRLNAVPDRSAIAVAALALSVTLALPRAARAETGPVTLPDSTVCESWLLPNGLGVTTRHVPRTSAVSITVAYRIGNAGDPTGREGLARLLAEAAFTAAAGEIPERTRDEMESLRPLGWNLEVGTRSTLLTEIASPAQLPVALRPGLRQITRSDLASPLGVVGIIAPALTDTAHPEFYLNALVIGSLCKDQWDPPAPPLTTRFKYSALDDPDLVRIYPPVS